MPKKGIDTIVWDLDNTPWDWVSYAAKAYPAMRDMLVRRTGATRDEVTECMRNYYDRAGTIESSWLVQDLGRQGLFDSKEIDEPALIRAVQLTFHIQRKRHLKLYEGFPEVLEMAAKNGVNNDILTDAPVYHAASRLIHLGLSKSTIRQMFAMPNSLPGEIPVVYRGRSNGGRYGLDFPVHLTDREKPDTDLEGLLGMTAEGIRERVAFVGDNGQKEMALAARFGSLGFHAKWGQPNKADLAVVQEFYSKNIGDRNFSQSTIGGSYPTVIPVTHPLDIPAILGWT